MVGSKAPRLYSVLYTLSHILQGVKLNLSQEYEVLLTNTNVCIEDWSDGRGSAVSKQQRLG